MCGFTGYLSTGKNNHKIKSDLIIQKMTNSLVHRGPDSEGFWCDSQVEIVLGFRRLAILDISTNGNQPMISKSGKYVITFNGEIYNHLDLRKKIQIEDSGISWISTSDTETLLAGFELWGIEETIKKCKGMFSFAVWCNKSRVLTLGRDRLGEKPLYYGWQGEGEQRVFLFGSEIKSFLKHPGFSKEINKDAISTFLRNSYIPAPHSIYKGIFKLLPGCLLRVSINDQNPIISKYWSASKFINGDKKSIFYSDAEAADKLDHILQKSVKQQMISDVPLGAFLSGGIDSSLIVSMMQSQSLKKIRTFTIGFNQKEFNEANHAKAIASHLQTDHSELYIDSSDLLDVIPNLPSIYDEPFADSSQIPTYLISQFAKQDVTVALSGDGGDELFGGYNRYKITNQYWNKLKHVPVLIRKLLSAGILSLSAKQIKSISSFLGKNVNYSNFADKLYKGANVLPSKDIYSLYKGLTSAYIEPDSIVIDGNESNEFFESNYQKFKGLDNLSMMMAMDLLTYMPDDILTKVDRAAMAVSLETRVPMLDHKVVEFALSLSNKYKLRNNQTKWLLKQTLYKYVPQNLIERPKSGFAIPIGIWLRTSLKDWADDLLDERTINDQGFFNAGLIMKRWHQHQSGSHNWEHFLWNVLMFQSWFINFHEKN